MVVSVALIVMSAEPVVPTGEESRNTPSRLSVMIEALVIVTGLFGAVFVARIVVNGHVGNLLPDAVSFDEKTEDRIAEVEGGFAEAVMKNCEPLVSGPLLAIARTPELVNCRAALISSSNLNPGPPLPSPLGSPPES